MTRRRLLTQLSHTAHACRPLVERFYGIWQHAGLQPKAKILVSFYQVCSTLTNVYGVRLHDSFTGWLTFVGVFGLDVFDLTYPSACLGSMETQLLFAALLPYAVLLVLSLGITAHAFALQKGESPPSQERSLHRDTTGSSAGSGWLHESLVSRCHCFTADLRKVLLREILLRWLSALVLVFYFFLPCVSRFIFEARRCESFVHNDSTRKRISYLLSDLSKHCNSGPSWTNEARDLDMYFWSFFVLWPVAVPTGFLALLLSCRKSLSNSRVTKVASASSFLWRDYDPSFAYWEAIDLWRKVRPALRHNSPPSQTRLVALTISCFVRYSSRPLSYSLTSWTGPTSCCAS